ncbi:MAG: BolA family protein [Alphaproteobacteria bacterium]
MTSLKKTIEQKIVDSLDPIFLEIIDQSDLHKGHLENTGHTETHFKVTIVSKAFDGLTHLERHRLIHNLLKEEIPRIHALSLCLREAEK